MDMSYYYYKYNCQICGKRTNVKKTMVKGDFNGRECHVCQKKMCYRCSVGGFCKKCIDSFPEDIGKPYERKAKIFRFFHYIYLYLIFILVLLGAFTLLFNFAHSDIVDYFIAGLFIFGTVLPTPLIIINVIAYLIELNFSDRGAKKLLAKSTKKQNFFN